MVHEQDRDALAEVLVAHAAESCQGDIWCRCDEGPFVHPDLAGPKHYDHLVVVLAEHDRQVAAAALREAAKDARQVQAEARALQLPTEYDRGVADAWDAVADGLMDRADRVDAAGPGGPS